jgi:hypothetical protein
VDHHYVFLVKIPESAVIAERFSQRMWCVMTASGEGMAATVGARRATVSHSAPMEAAA